MNRNELIDAINSIETEASSGHYLSRLLTVAETVGVHHLKINMLYAAKAYLDRFCKPAGLDALTTDVSMSVLHICTQAGLTANDLKPIAWGVDLDALEVYKMQDARKQA